MSTPTTDAACYEATAGFVRCNPNHPGAVVPVEVCRRLERDNRRLLESVERHAQSIDKLTVELGPLREDKAVLDWLDENLSPEESERLFGEEVLVGFLRSAVLAKIKEGKA